MSSLERSRRRCRLLVGRLVHPLFRVHVTWHAVTGACQGCSITPPPGPVTGKTRGSGGDWRCLGCRRPQGVCPEPPRQRSPPLPRMRARWHRFQGACQGCSITPPPGPVTGKTRGSVGERRCLGGRRPQGGCPEPPRQRSPPLPRMRTRWHRFQGACPGCSITPPGAVLGQKGEGAAGSGAARGAGGRRGSA